MVICFIKQAAKRSAMWVSEIDDSCKNYPPKYVAKEIRKNDGKVHHTRVYGKIKEEFIQSKE